MNRSAFLPLVIFLLGIGICTTTQAAAQDAPATYSGDVRSRSTLTGDWGGVRNDLARKGVTFDLTLTQVEQGVTNGGIETGWEFGGRGNLTLNADTQKLGLWPGGFFLMEVEGNFGKDVNLQTGAFLPVNSNQFFPMPENNQLNLPAVTLTQFVSEYAAAFVGKMDTTTGDANEFAHGKGDTQFFNLAFNFNPVGILVAPYSTLGAGVMVLPTKDPKAAILSASAISTDGTANHAGFDTVFNGNTTYTAEGRVKTDFFGLTGHQLAGGMYSTKSFGSLEQSLRFIIETGSIERKNNSWAFFYNFDQYLYEPKKGSGRGVGIFGRFGASDGNPNPVHYFYSIGIGGKGVLPGRELDQFGVGYYYIDISNPKFTGPLGTRSFLRDEYGFEGYYNFAVTPWMKITPDLQLVRPARKQVIDFSGSIPIIVKENISTAAVLGLRLQLIF
ncbi:MAG: carbohydrate porin [bacterium]|jgi:porin